MRARHWPGQRSRACALRLSDERANMEVDVLVLCTSDQQHNDGNILATIGGELIDDEAMSELANTESSTFDESRTDDGDVCQCDDAVTSPDERMLTPDDSRSGGVAPGMDIRPVDDRSAGFSDVSVLPAGLSYTTQSDIVEEEKTFSNGAAVNRRNSTDCEVDACRDYSVVAVDCVVGNECDLSAPASDASDTVCSVTEHENHHIETLSDTQSPNSGNLETTSVACAEMTPSVSVIDIYAVVDLPNVISDVDNTLVVSVPDTESAVFVTDSSCIDAVLADDTQQTSGFSDEAVRRELAEAISIEAKKKSFRVRFHEDHVTGYHDPPTPWREGFQCILFLYIVTR